MANNSWFQCKTHYQKMTDSGSEKRVSETYLVDALLWGEAEARITKELQPFVKAGEELFIDDIARFPIDRILEEGATELDDRYYKVVQAFITVNEETGEDRRTNYKYLVRASDTERVQEVMKEYNKDSVGDWIIVSIQETAVMDVYYYSSEGAIVDILDQHSDISPVCHLYKDRFNESAADKVIMGQCRDFVERLCERDGKAINIRKRTLALIKVDVSNKFDEELLKNSINSLLSQHVQSEYFSSVIAFYLGCLQHWLDYVAENYNTWRESFIDADTGEAVWITRAEKKES